MRFEALYYADRLRVVNPEGDVGVLVLWTPRPVAERKLEELVPGILDPGSSRVAVISNLYGGGLLAMFCNLLYNPQIRHLVAIGQDLNQPACAEIDAFLTAGLETEQMFGASVYRIRGTDRRFSRLAGFDADRLRSTLTFRNLGMFSAPDCARRLRECMRQLPVRPNGWSADRIAVEMPMSLGTDYQYRPSNSAAHQVVRLRPLDCWEELVTRVVRFGVPVELSDGPRVELTNAHAIVTDPAEESPQVLASAGFDIGDLHRYQAEMFKVAVPEDVPYTYGNRLGGFFDLGSSGPQAGPPGHQPDAARDTLAAVAATLRVNPESRRAYVSLWENTVDLSADGVPRASAPCLTTLCFRLTGGGLHLTATYRAHNLLSAWMRNVYGLIAIQRQVAGEAGLAAGPISIISHSLTVDPRDPAFELARQIAAGWKTDGERDRERGGHSLREDPNGYFQLTVDPNAKEIVAEHCYDGLVLSQYRAATAAKIERQIIGDMAVGLPSHALWLGRQLAIKEAELRGTTSAGD